MKTFITTVLLCLAATTAMAQQTAQKVEPEAKAKAKASIKVRTADRGGRTPLRGAQRSSEYRRSALTYYIL